LGLLARLLALFGGPPDAGVPHDRLTADERERANRIGVYAVYGYDEDKMWPHSYVKAAAAFLTSDEAAAAMKQLPLEPGWSEFRILGPRALSSDAHDLGAAAVRDILAQVAAGAPHEVMEAPVTEQELAEAERHPVYFLYCTERMGGDRGRSRVEEVYLSREEAEFALKRKGLVLGVEKDGYEISGPSRLNRSMPKVTREALRRLAAGEAGPLRVPAEYW
jgi:hypothetical protein